MEEPIVNFDLITTKILALDDAMRYVRFIDEKGKLIHDQVKKDKTLLQNQEGLGKFSGELPIMRQMQELFDESLGKTRFMHIIRDKVHQFIYYVDSMSIYITCERNTDPSKIVEITTKIDSIFKS